MNRMIRRLGRKALSRRGEMFVADYGDVIRDGC